ncbi:hypothetical protein OIU74_002928 [Salix koriyanagi]|uniref:Uncharacterized protein n=1 Tax=Salix koriyanagi TaxID=2511006 RepID=A0A9Q0UWQ7_9ROSI|nr:hypothetical protein OIU74_002928 [Salix koriyanagi]
MIIIRDSQHIIRFSFLKIRTFPNPENRWNSRILPRSKYFYTYFFRLI